MTNYAVMVEIAKEVGLGRPTPNFSNQEVNTAIRNAFLEELGTDKIDINTYDEYKHAIFRILRETVSPIINERLEIGLERFAEIRQVAWGETIEFELENPELFEVAVISTGTNNMRRQRIENGKVPVTVRNFGITIYDEFYRFLTGDVNWVQMINKVVQSWEREIATQVYQLITNSYATIDATFKYTGSLSEDELMRVLGAVEALYGSAMIVGTKQGLSRLKPDYVGDATKDRFNEMGYLGVYNGYEIISVANVFKAGTFEFALDNNEFLILPANQKLVKIIHEGDAIIRDVQNNSDMSIEHTFIKRTGIGMPIAQQFGIVRFS